MFNNFALIFMSYTFIVKEKKWNYIKYSLDTLKIEDDYFSFIW